MKKLDTKADFVYSIDGLPNVGDSVDKIIMNVGLRCEKHSNRIKVVDYYATMFIGSKSFTLPIDKNKRLKFILSKDAANYIRKIKEDFLMSNEKVENPDYVPAVFFDVVYNKEPQIKISLKDSHKSYF